MISLTEKAEEKRIENRQKACMIEIENEVLCIDPSLPLIKVLGKKYSLLILALLGNNQGKKNFHAIFMAIPYSSANAISQRLKELISTGLVERNASENHIIYSLTEYGKKVRKLLVPLIIEAGKSP
ncbi:MAG: helix-turn-helix transcriptional regulator [Thermoplasmatales archaeon]|nr:helix-turn-helix transcriptional regulator [Thermoplasmatales archaeon]MCW6170501.1 helix-turn-helix transcriptional regulator [Thermoplasmatales archaeon]